MRIIDISLPISPDMLVWPGDPGVRLEPMSRIANGDAANVSELTLGTHTGTHVDPPIHFVEGAPTVEMISLDALVGDAYVADLTGAAQIGAAELEGLALPGGVRRLLLKTSNSQLWRRERVEFPERFVAIDESGARWILERGIRLIGVDFLSIEARGAPGHPVHVALLRAGVVAVEGLDLGDVEPGPYTLACLPLKIAGGDGAPARAVLLKEE